MSTRLKVETETGSRHSTSSRWLRCKPGATDVRRRSALDAGSISRVHKAQELVFLFTDVASDRDDATGWCCGAPGLYMSTAVLVRLPVRV